MEPPGLDQMPPGYRVLFHRALEVAREDPRIRAVWVGGSLARGVADAGSDLDLILAVDDASHAEFVAGWESWLHAVTPTVLARLMPGFVVSLTPSCERFDVVIEPCSQLPTTPFRYRLVVHDPDDLSSQVPSPEEPVGPQADVMQGLVEEFLRQQAIFPAAVVARQDWLLGVVGVHVAHGLLYQLLAEANKPAPPMGVKQWSAKLAPAHKELLLQLPVPGPERGALVPAMREVAAAMRSEGRAVLERAGGTWPAELDDAVLAYWQGV